MPHPAPGTYSPATGAEIPPVVATTTEQLHQLVSRARHAQVRWSERSLEDRITALRRVTRRCLERAFEVAEVIEQESGKSQTDALLNEVVSIDDYLTAAATEARAALATVRPKMSPLDFPGKRIVIEQVPRGVVGIIAPWNYPLSNFFKSLFPALLAGNAVLLKPSEYTPRTGAWFAAQLEAELPTGLVAVVQGGGEVGAALLDVVDAVTFTGSVATGRKVAERAAQRLIPCSAELGGKDAAIVLADCDIHRTVAGVAQWALHNCGQNCAAIERVYVERAIADDFVARIAALAKGLRVAPTANADVGPLQSHAQLDVVVAHVEDAVARGATLVVGGAPTGEGLGFWPTVLDHCTDDMLVMTEETFGPIIAIRRVDEADEAVRLANASAYGLNGSVWSRNIDRALDLARRLDVGVAYVNNHAFGGALATVPWTGVKDTGTGIAASRFGYGTFARPRTLFVDTNSNPDPWWMPLDDSATLFVATLRDRALGSKVATLKLLPLLRRRLHAVLGSARE